MASFGLEEHITCSVCLGIFEKPQMLQCLHTFCEECVQGVAKQNKVTCPTCRGITDVRDVKNDFRTESLLASHQKANQIPENGLKCDACKDATKETISFCNVCEEYLCTYCTKSHKGSKSSRDHTITSLADHMEEKKSVLDKAISSLITIVQSEIDTVTTTEDAIRRNHKKQISQIDQQRWEFIEGIDKYHEKMIEMITSVNNRALHKLHLKNQCFASEKKIVERKTRDLSSLSKEKDYSKLLRVLPILHAETEEIKSKVQSMKNRFSSDKPIPEVKLVESKMFKPEVYLGLEIHNPGQDQSREEKLTRQIRLGPTNMEAPLPFIEIERSGHMTVNEDLVYILTPHPVSVIAIVGMAGSGKSSIMNEFFGSKSGFSVGSTAKPHTKGIWLWARPHPVHPTRTLILLDTQGWHGRKKREESNDMIILTLAVVLSKCLIYNSKKYFQDDVNTELQTMAKYLETTGYQKEVSRFYPCNFFFLFLRDFPLDLKDDDRLCTEYLESPRQEKSKSIFKNRASLKPQKGIHEYFLRRKCLTIDRPTDNEMMFQRLESMQETELRPEFLSQKKEAISAVLAEATDMSLEVSPINGRRFLDIAHCYVKSLNDGDMSCIASERKMFKESEYLRIERRDGYLNDF